jgi:hypothetical protein
VRATLNGVPPTRERISSREAEAKVTVSASELWAPNLKWLASCRSPLTFLAGEDNSFGEWEREREREKERES